MQTVASPGIQWNLAGVWNSCAFKDNKPLVKRDYVYASEIGMPMYDRFLKMNAVPYTNPPNQRSLRKFLAGNIFEYLTKSILIACGVYRHEEVKIDAAPYDDCLWVHGRCDFIAGGHVDEEEAVRHLSKLNLPDYLEKIGHSIIEQLQGKRLEEKILELKAVSTFAMDKVERMGTAMPNHIQQGYHYQKNGHIPADIAYICKDDCRMAQFRIDGAAAEPIYRKDLEQITHFFTKNKKPPLEPLAYFDNTIGKFSKHLGVEYSPYLSHYGFKEPDDYRQAIGYVDKWNRTLARYVLIETGQKTPTGKPIVITPKNKEIRAEIEKAKYNFDELISVKIELGNISDEEDE